MDIFNINMGLYQTPIILIPIPFFLFFELEA